MKVNGQVFTIGGEEVETYLFQPHDEAYFFYGRGDKVLKIAYVDESMSLEELFERFSDYHRNRLTDDEYGRIAELVKVIEVSEFDMWSLDPVHDALEIEELQESIAEKKEELYGVVRKIVSSRGY